MPEETTSAGVYVIAEMACSHDGKLNLGRKIIDGAGMAGADAVQFQIWKLAEMMVPHHPDYAFVKSIELSHEEWADLYAYSRSLYPAMAIIACVYEPGTIDFAERLGVDAFKLHSADLSNPEILRYAAQTGKRIDLSVGASTLDEIQHAVEAIRDVASQDVWLMYGYQNFPTPTDQIHLDYMMSLRRLFHLSVGYQDHTDAEDDAAFWLPAAAVGMGVDILEKHITHDRSLKGVDHQAALNPDEFERFTAMVREIETAKGNSCPRPFSQEELKYRKYSKKSLVASRQLEIGEKITKDALKAMRASELGLPPDWASRLIGRSVSRAISAYELIQEADLEWRGTEGLSK